MVNLRYSRIRKDSEIYFTGFIFFQTIKNNIETDFVNCKSLTFFMYNFQNISGNHTNVTYHEYRNPFVNIVLVFYDTSTTLIM